MQAEDRLLWQIFAPFRRMAVVSVLLASAAIACSVGLISTSAYLISAAALRPSIAELQVAIVGVRFFGLFRGIFVYLERLYSHSVNFKLVGGLRSWFFQKLEPLAPADLLGDRSGDLLARAISDIETLESVYVRIIAPPLTAGVVLAGMLIFLGQINSALSLSLAGFFFFGGVVLPSFLVRWMRPSARKIAAERSRLHADTVDFIQGSADILAFGLENTMLERLDQEDRSYTQVIYQQSVQMGSAGAGMVWITGMAGIAALALGAHLVEQGALAGVNLALVGLGTMASFEALNPFPQAAQTLLNAREAAGRLLHLTSRNPSVIDPPQPHVLPDQLDFRLQKVSFIYPGCETPALEEIDLNLPEGRHLAVVGQSGAGKSTLAYLMLRVWDPTTGSIRLGDAELREYAAGDLRQAIGYVSPRAFVFNDTLRQNLAIANPSANEDQLLAACKKAQLLPLIESRKEGIDLRLGEHGLQISGGEKIRLAAGRVILQNPRLVVLDEPTANLDIQTESELMDTLFEIFSDRTILWLTHRLVKMERMDEILVMKAGRVVERGVLADLLALKGTYYRLISAQNRWLRDLLLDDSGSKYAT